MAFDPTTARPLDSQTPAITRPKGVFNPATAMPASVAALTRPQVAASQGASWTDLPQDFAGSAVNAVGATVRGFGEGARTIARPIVAGVNALAGSEVLSEPVNPLVRPAAAIESWGKSIQDSTSQAYRDQVNATTPKGEIHDPSSWGFEGDPTALGAAGQVVRGLGSVAPVVLSAIASRGATIPQALGLNAGFAAAQGGGAAAQSEEQRIVDMPEQQLATVPGYQALVAQGMSAEQARAELATQTGRSAFSATAPVSALSGLIIGGPLSRPLQDRMASAIGGGVVRRMAVEGVGEGVAEGTQEVLEQVATTAGANAETGEQRGLMDDSLANFTLGAATGGVMGAGSAAIHRPGSPQAAANPQIAEQPSGPIARAAQTITRPNVGAAPIQGVQNPAPQPQHFPDAQPGSLADAANAIAPAAPASTPLAQEPSAPVLEEPAGPPKREPVVTQASWINAETGEMGSPTEELLTQQMVTQLRAQQEAGLSNRINSTQLSSAWGVNAKAVKQARTRAVAWLAEQGEATEAEARSVEREQQQSDLEDLIRAPATPEQGVGESPTPLVDAGQIATVGPVDANDISRAEQVPESADQGLEVPAESLIPEQQGNQTSVDGTAQSYPRTAESFPRTAESFPRGPQEQDVAAENAGGRDSLADRTPSVADGVDATSVPPPVSAEQRAEQMARLKGEVAPQVIDATEVTSPTEARAEKPARESPRYWDMRLEDLERQAESVKARGEETDARVLGEQLTPWRDAHRRLSSTDDNIAASAQADIDAIESTLSPVDRDALYGIGGRDEDFDDVADYRDALADAQVESPADAVSVMSKHLAKLGGTKGSDPSNWQRDEQVSYAAMSELRERIESSEWDSADIQKKALALAASKYADPADAGFMLDRFFKLAKPAAAKSAAAPTALPKIRDAQIKRLQDRSNSGSLNPEGEAELKKLKAAAAIEKSPAPAVEAAAAEAAISPLNDIPEPTQAQKEAGNYTKGHVRLHGMDISIENPAGTKRDPKWKKLKHHYGYIRRTEGADGDHVDVFLGPRSEDADAPVFVVDQVNADGSFDEHKVMLGFDDEASARAGYLANYSKGWQGLSAIKQMSTAEFKAWLKDGNTKKPASIALDDDVETRIPGVGDAEAARRERHRGLSEGHFSALHTEIGWSETGGKLIREPERADGLKSEVVGRTSWVGKAGPNGESNFWRNRPDSRLSEKVAHQAFKKFADGEKLKPVEQRFIDYAKKTADDYATDELEAADLAMDHTEAVRAEAIEALQDDYAIEVNQADADEALTIIELVQRAADAGVSRAEILAIVEGPGDLYAGRLWRAIKARTQDNGSDQRTTSGNREGSADSEESRQAPAAASETESASAQEVKPTSSGLFGAPTARETVDAAARDRDDRRNGKAGTGRTDMLSGDGELFAGNRPEQLDVEGEASFDAPSKPAAPRAPTQSDQHTLSIAKAVREAMKDWGTNAPPVRVLRSAEDMPADVKRGAPTQYKRARGLYHKGVAYIVAPNEPSVAGALVTLAHEVVGHHGIEAILDDHVKGGWGKLAGDFDRLFDNPSLATKDLRSVIEDVKRRYPNASSKTRAKETIAIMAERNLRNGLMGRVVAAVRAFLRKLFPTMRWSDADIRRLLAKSEEYIHTDNVADDARRAAVAAMSFSQAANAPAFYSALAKSIDTAKGAPKTTNAKAWKEWLDGRQRNGEFKADERAWLGLDAWLDEQDANITRQQIADFVKANEVGVQETVLKTEDGGYGIMWKNLPAGSAEGDYHSALGSDQRFASMKEAKAFANSIKDDPNNDGAIPVAVPTGELPTTHPLWDSATGGAPKFSEYTIPGGKDYRELLMTLPAQAKPQLFKIERREGAWAVVGPTGDTLKSFYSEDSAHYDAQSRNRAADTNYNSSHFPNTPNIIAHIRFNERTDADGNRVMFLEEVQSDWHQEGRKKGYGKGRPRYAVMEAGFPHASRIFETRAEAEAAAQLIGSQARIEERPATDGVPDAPFKTTWPMLAMKRAIRWAAENGFDKVAWTTGEQQAARYDLSKQVSEMVYWKDGADWGVSAVDPDGKTVIDAETVADDKLEASFGKDVAERMHAGEGESNSEHGFPMDSGEKALRGSNLTVGGEGMKAFYDKMLPNELGKYTKKWGTKPGRIDLVRSGELNMADGDITPAVDNAHVIDISPEMRAGVMEGQPLFSLGGNESSDVDVNAPAFKRWFGGSKIVDGDGRPLVVYHGSPDARHTVFNEGSHFTADPEYASVYTHPSASSINARKKRADAPAVYSVYLNISRPFDTRLPEIRRIFEREFLGKWGNGTPLADSGLPDWTDSRDLLEWIDETQQPFDGLILDEGGTPTGGHRGLSYVPIQPGQIKSATGNNGDFDGTNPDINFSLPGPAIDSIEEVARDPDATAFKQAKAWVAGKWQDFKPTTLGALQLRHLLEIAEKPLPGSKFYADIVQRMGADRNQSLEDIGIKAQAWRDWAGAGGLAGFFGKQKPEAKVLSDFMHESTILGVDGSEEYKPLHFMDSRENPVPFSRKGIAERIKAIRGQIRGRSGDDKRAMMDEIKYLQGMAGRERARKKAYPKMVARWQALSPGAQQIFKETRDHYAQHSEAVEAALLDRIKALDMPETHKRAVVTRLRVQFETQRLEGVYFPLQRFGDYWISATNADGEQTFVMFESFSEYEKASKDLKRRGYTIEASGKKDSNPKASDAPSGTFVAEIMTQLQKAGVGDQVQDQIYQMYLKALPELSMRKHSVHRKAIAGYSDDALRAFAKNGFHGSHQLSKLRFGHLLQASVDALQVSLDNRRKGGMEPADAAIADALLAELKKRHDWVMSPKDSQAANVASSIGFIYYLGVTPAAALVNLTQGAQVTFPVLAAKFGAVKAGRMLAAATRDSMRTWGNIEKTLKSDDEKAAYKVLRERGDIEKTQAHSLAGISEGDSLRTNPAYAKVMSGVSYLFSRMEIINREGAGIAAFRLARSEGKSFDEAVQYASDIINGTHFDYSNANRARFMQGNVAKVLLQFRSYSVGMSWMLGRNAYLAFKGEDAETRRQARRTLTGIVGVTSLMSGVMGLPMIGVASMVMSALHAAFGDDDEPYEFDVEFRQFLADHLGPEAAKWVSDGAVNRLGADVAGRVKLSDLWFRGADRELEGRDLYYHLLEQVAGPMGGIAKNVLVGQQQVSEGHVWRGVETMLPKFAKDAMKATRFAKEGGATTLRGDQLLDDVTTSEKFIQALGFSPTRLTEQYRENRALKNYEQHILDRRQQLINGFALSMRMGDEELRSAVLEKMRSFSTTYPEIRIDAASLRRSMQTRARYSAQAESGIVLNKRVADRVREQVGVQ